MRLLKPKSFVSIGSSYFIGEDEANQLSNYLLQIRNLSEDRKETKSKLENTENTTQEMRKELQNEIKDKEKTIQNYVKTVSKLRKTIRSKDFELAGSSARQDGLLHQLDNLVKKSDLQKTSFLARLQAEREDQRKQFNSLAERSTELINEVLDQQQSDQKKSWWEKIKVCLSPHISIPWLKTENEVQKEEPIEKEKEYYFYPSRVNELTGLQKVKEKFLPETEEWEVVDVESNVNLSKKIRKILRAR